MDFPRKGGGAPWDRLLNRYSPRQILFSLALLLASLGGIGMVFAMNRSLPPSTGRKGKKAEPAGDANASADRQGAPTPDAGPAGQV